MRWFDYTEQERIKEVYTKYTIQDFWNWWSNNDNRVMEVRITGFDSIKSIANKHNLRYSASGVYVWTADMLKLVMKETRQMTSWFGINSRKQNWNKYGTKSFGGTDYNVNNIEYLFIDIDRVVKNGPANKFELENCDKLANIVLERLGTQGWNKNYIKICSGNGVQLLIKLDIPLKLPNVEFNNETKSYSINEEFDKLRKIIPDGIGKDILKFCNNFKEELGVEVDKACFNIGRVGSLPFTRNYKYDGYTIRGIIEIQNGVNEGLTDYIMSKEEDINVYKSKQVFTNKVLDRKHRLKIDNIEQNSIIRLMLDNQLPYGQINNKLWFQLKCLLRDSKFDLKSPEFVKIHKELERKYKGNFTLNLPESKFAFDENVVNSYCFDHLIQPLYPVYANRTKRLNMLLDTFSWNDKDILLTDYNIKLLEEHNIISDIFNFKSYLNEKDNTNQDKYAQFLRLCINKYGEETTKYYFNYVMLKILSFN